MVKGTTGHSASVVKLLVGGKTEISVEGGRMTEGVEGMESP